MTFVVVEVLLTFCWSFLSPHLNFVFLEDMPLDYSFYSQVYFSREQFFNSKVSDFILDDKMFARKDNHQILFFGLIIIIFILFVFCRCKKPEKIDNSPPPVWKSDNFEVQQSTIMNLIFFYQYPDGISPKDVNFHVRIWSCGEENICPSIETKPVRNTIFPGDFPDFNKGQKGDKGYEYIVSIPSPDITSDKPWDKGYYVSYVYAEFVDYPGTNSDLSNPTSIFVS